MGFRYLLLTCVVFSTLADIEGRKNHCKEGQKCQHNLEKDSREKDDKSETNPVTTTPNLVTTTASQQTSDENKSSQAISIFVPLIICLLLIILIISVFLWRRVRKSSSTTTTTVTDNNYQGLSIRNNTYQGHSEERQSYNLTPEYAEIPPESVLPEGASDYVFETIDIEPFDKTDRFNYDHMKQTSIQFVDKSYSHITENETGKLFITDNEYGRSGCGQNVLEDRSYECDRSYNRLPKLSALNAAQKEKLNMRTETDENDPEYHHALAGGRDPENKTTDYSQLNRSWQSSKPPAQKAEHQYSRTMTGSKVSTSEKLRSDQKLDGCDYYEAADGISNKYFILEPHESLN